MRHFLLPPSQSLRLPEMQRKRTTEGKSTGEEEKRSGEVAGGAPQLADDDRSCKSPAIADVIEMSASPAAAPELVRIEVGCDQNVPMAA